MEMRIHRLICAHQSYLLHVKKNIRVVRLCGKERKKRTDRYDDVSRKK